jgi:RimJ/RimL family protein N-acetyltransferase
LTRAPRPSTIRNMPESQGPGVEPLPEPREYRLRDGTPLLVRPIHADDKDLLRDLFRRLSPEARYQRFLATISELSDAQVRSLTELDYHDHMAWLALDPSQHNQPVLGEARYIRVARAPEVAEVAVTVVDAWQGRGVGTLLFRMVCKWATAHGVRTFRAYALETNDSMIRIFKDIGARVVRHEEGVAALDIPVPATAEELPDTPTGRAFREVARLSRQMRARQE